MLNLKLFLVFSDMVVLVGDLVDDTVEHLKTIVEPLGELSAPRGMYFVTGDRSFFCTPFMSTVKPVIYGHCFGRLSAL